MLWLAYEARPPPRCPAPVHAGARRLEAHRKDRHLRRLGRERGAALSLDRREGTGGRHGRQRATRHRAYFLHADLAARLPAERRRLRAEDGAAEADHHLHAAQAGGKTWLSLAGAL